MILDECGEKVPDIFSIEEFDVMIGVEVSDETRGKLIKRNQTFFEKNRGQNNLIAGLI